MKNYRKTKHVSSLVPESESSRYRRHTDDGSPVDKLFNLNKVNNYSRNQLDDSVISAHSKLWDSVSEYSKIKNDRKFKNYVLKNVFQVSRLKRDVREATKYIETAIILDKAMVSLFAEFFFSFVAISRNVEMKALESFFFLFLSYLINFRNNLK